MADGSGTAQDVHVTVVGGFQQVNLRLDDVVDEIHQARTEIGQDVRNEGELIREAIRQTISTLGQLPSLLPSYIYNVVNVMYQKSVSVMPPTPDSMQTQGAWNA